MQNPDIHISEALYTDLPDIMELLEDLNLDMEDLHYSQFKVAKTKGNLIAAGRIRVHENGLNELCSLGVDPEFRNIGIGSAIVAQLLDQVKNSELSLVTEIPEYFMRMGFQSGDESNLVLKDKIRRCKEIYACKDPVVMVHRSS